MYSVPEPSHGGDQAKRHLGQRFRSLQLLNGHQLRETARITTHMSTYKVVRSALVLWERRVPTSGGRPHEGS